MPGTVVTLVAPLAGGLSDKCVVTATALLHRLAAGSVTADVLAQGQALDLLLNETPPQAGLLQAIRDEFQNLNMPVDVFVQPSAPDRRKKLLVADMDATIVVGETLDELAARMGVQDQVAPVTARAMRGEIDFAQALAARVALLKGMPLSVLEEVRDAISLSPGAQTLVRTMAAHGARCILASGGFDAFTAPVAGRCGFHAHFGNRLEIDDTLRATGRVVPPLVDKERKRVIVVEQAQGLGLPPGAAMAVGDGANDIPMLQSAGVGVAYHAKPVVCAATPFQVRHGDLTALLYLQGFRKSEFASA